jgi:hypothetical protein
MWPCPQVRKLVARLIEHAAKEAAGAISGSAGSNSTAAAKGGAAAAIRPSPLSLDNTTPGPAAAQATAGTLASQQGAQAALFCKVAHRVLAQC